ncbi:MAG: F0F1 ATP synthase subunit B [Candidatus Kerfeldbacteria bacterium]|nr:F0F1 ATP synthase subunit B [Candidatus Kerfeldbacteria bacterium]
MELLSALGIDYKILIAQVLNFVLLGFILYKIGYKPILKFVQERTATIEQGVKQASEAKAALDNAMAEQQRLIAQAKVDAQAVLDEAKTQATAQGQVLVERSKAEASKVIEKAKQDIRLEQEKMLQAAKAELGEVVIVACERILKEKMTAPADQALIERALADLKQ